MIQKTTLNKIKKPISKMKTKINKKVGHKKLNKNNHKMNKNNSYKIKYNNKVKTNKIQIQKPQQEDSNLPLKPRLNNQHNDNII